MEARVIKTRPLNAPQDDLPAVLSESIEILREKDVVAVSSKVVAIWQGRCITIPDDDKERQKLKEELIRKEAEYYLEKDENYPYSRIFTIYEGMFGSTSGIDESNGNGHFILLPKNADEAARSLRGLLAEKFGLSELGVIIVDSRSSIMRNGTIGMALGHAGFHALRDYRGTEDIFGRTMQFERMHVADCLASAATLTMGEGNECTPVVVFSDIPHVDFNGSEESDPLLSSKVIMDNDVYAQFIAPHKWKKGGA